MATSIVDMRDNAPSPTLLGTSALTRALDWDARYVPAHRL